MRKPTKRTRWIAGGALAAAVALGVGGVALAGDAIGGDDDRPLAGGDLDRASRAALAEAGGGEVVDSERDDGRFEVEVLRPDGTRVEVTLDDSFAVVHSELDDHDDPDDDRPVTGEELERVTQAALAETGEGTVTDAEQEADGTYEVEVRRADGTEVDLRLDEDLAVTHVRVDDDHDDDLDDD